LSRTLSTFVQPAGVVSTSAPLFATVATRTSPGTTPAGALTEIDGPRFRVAVLVERGWIVVRSLSFAATVQVCEV